MIETPGILYKWMQTFQYLCCFGIVQWMSNSLNQHKCTDYERVTCSTLHNVDTKYTMLKNTQTVSTN